ncbi:SCO family protein [Shewanella sp. A25]|nr:SCO family protein [Shewanella shenzhenensis]
MYRLSSTALATGIIVATLLILPGIAYLNQAISGSYGIATHQETSIDFTWQDIHGRNHQFSDWRQGPSYLFLGFLNCSQICPIRTHQVQMLWQQLNEQEQSQLRFMFITIDPQNDLPALREQMIDSQSAQFVSAELPQNQLAKLQRQLAEKSSFNDDLGEHSGHLYLISTEGKLSQIYTQRQLDSNKLLTDLKTLMYSK